MSGPLWIAAAAVVACLVAAWSYGRREEPVPGRVGPALLRGLALFLLLAGPTLPALRGGIPRERGPTVLLDISPSMSLPAYPGGPSRLDSARSVLARLDPGRVVLFGDAPLAVPLDSALAAGPSARRSRLVPALEAARRAGAESVLVVTDGAWDDRSVVPQTAARLGMGVRELRVGRPVPRLGLTAAAPTRVRAGDTAWIEATLLAGGVPGIRGGATRDSVRVGLWTEGREVAGRDVEVPAPGRTRSVRLALVPGPSASDAPEWRTYELRLPRGADPLAAADRRRLVLEVGAAPEGAVLVSTEPDWEPRFLLPRLDRASLGGAVGFARLADDRWVEIGPAPRAAREDEVRRAVGGARLLVVQGSAPSFPAWLAGEAEGHARRLLLPRAAGPVPGTPVTLSDRLPGEWYASGPSADGPVAGYLAGLSLDELPPLTRLRRVSGRDPSPSGADAPPAGDVAPAPLAGRRDRRGESLPLLVAGRNGSRRWVVAAGEGYWRWASRDGVSRRAYEGLVTGLVDWLLEDRAPRDIELEQASADMPLRWRVAPGVSELELAVRDSAGSEAWTGRWDVPPAELLGPALPAGPYRIEARGRSERGTFRRERPVELADASGELLPRVADEPLSLDADAAERRREPAVPARGARAVWPFAAAAVLLCGEWAWRRRIGLR